MSFREKRILMGRGSINTLRQRKGFTIVEILVAVAIIAALMALFVPVLIEARRKGKTVICKNNLRQIYAALLQYDTNNNIYQENYPSRLTHLSPSYVKDIDLYLCPFDSNRGLGPGLKPGEPDDDKEEWREGDLPDEKPCSYLYEFSERRCGDDFGGWWEDWLVYWEFDDIWSIWTPYFVWEEDIDRNSDGFVTWQEAKFFQLYNADVYVAGLGWPGDGIVPEDWPDVVDSDYPLMNYPRTYMPILRCFFHMPHQKIDDQNTKEVLNLMMEGNVRKSGPAWEPQAYQMVPKEDFAGP